MTKQMIEIDVPEGYEVGGKCEYYDSCTKKQWITLYLIKKKPEFIEVRDYLAFDYRGVPIKLTLNTDELHLAGAIESDDRAFIRWIDKEPRRVEI